MFPLDTYGRRKVGEVKSRADRLAVVLDDLLAVLFHGGVQEGSGRDDDHRAVGVLDGGSVFITPMFTRSLVLLTVPRSSPGPVEGCAE